MISKSLDVYVCLKLCLGNGGKAYAQLGEELGMSASEVHAAVRRGAEAGLVKPESKRVVVRPSLITCCMVFAMLFQPCRGV